MAREVLRIELRGSGKRSESDVERECDWIVKDTCFSLRMYEVVAGEWRTGAEVCRQWLLEGYTKEQCKKWVQEGQFTWKSGDLQPVPDAALRGIEQKLQQELKAPFMQRRKCRARELEDAVCPNPQEP